ncbi:slipin family protein [uncultured Ellagibacter sp.]|uniref:slipin family protein n=1 Tax=uncultured Ellagibacter sp. TaxID=2137580 RepID=UPI00263880EF|nr:slipin family protein [uncultured Ellagibacter sp.]
MPEVVPDASTEVVGERASSSGVLVFSIAVFLVSLCVVMGLSSLLFGKVGIVAIACSFVVAMLAVMSAHIAQQWERVVVLRLGEFNRVSGPGLYWTIPIIEQNAMRVDTRIRSTTFGAEETLTSDLVPINVNAVLFWMVWDAKAACTEVGDFSRAVELAAQTALRDAIGRAGAAEVAIRREQLDRELKSTLEEKVALWGITILSVEVRDILLPEELQDVMSLEAQAEQRKKARIILMEAEQDISDMLDDISKAYDANDSALRLRAMHLLYESVRETGGTVVVPSSFSEGFSDVLPDTMKDALGHK